MFRIYLMLTYLLPGIYVFFRVYKEFISPGYKWHFSVIFVLLFLIFPLSGFFNPSESGAIQKSLAKISGYLLPFFLYIFLLLVLYDIFLLVNYFVKWFPPEMRKSLSYRTVVFLSVSVLSLLIVAGGAINLNTIRVSEYKITVPAKKTTIKKLKVAFVADFHIHPGVPLNFIERYTEKINKIQPDLLLYGGDIVDDRNIHPKIENVLRLFNSIHPKYGVYGVLGNHEFYRGHTDGDFFRKAGIVLLNDSVVQIDSSFIVAGRYDEHFRNRQPVHEILGENIPELPIIMLDHRPTQLNEVSQSKVNVQFSGHTHNGQLFPFNFIIKKMYELGWGYLKKENTHFFVTSGLRLWGPPVKTTGKSEIILVDFKFE